ncbi:tetratricopeptide repeat protein [Altererythrobacter luteolus]|uniref:Ancillary SecYEG translocon subunit n=1 Tax=Pontixanthobacter luteolus TaxID=295089 RepID=A0A6I4V1R9_9SPHN|nr:tetratricopeptide repeat protein [Pontixanthobacter luteolus]MXP46996.1 tetratricopeptide repeat protein [Pontixanthobacter luteolus]
MALTPTTPANPSDQRKDRAAAQEDVLMREVDEAVRQDEFSDLVARYGKPLLAVVLIGLAAFAGYLYWDGQQESALEQQSETMTSALDQLEAGNLDTATTTLSTLVDGGDAGVKANAMMLQAGIAMEQGKTEEGARLFAQIAADTDAPQLLRELATIREVSAKFDTMKPEDVITRLKPMVEPGNAWFGSAGEMVAMAYLEQGKRKEAGALFAEISKNDEVPDSMRSRTRQLAGLLGVDAIEDVDEVLDEVAAASGEAPQQPAQ